MQVRFYHTLGCHLCELAEALLVHSALADRLVVEAIDIADHDALLERYGVRIPVVQRVDTEMELDWPFDEVALARFLTAP